MNTIKRSCYMADREGRFWESDGRAEPQSPTPQKNPKGDKLSNLTRHGHQFKEDK
jgi:hypothetical protein